MSHLSEVSKIALVGALSLFLIGCDDSADKADGDTPAKPTETASSDSATTSTGGDSPAPTQSSTASDAAPATASVSTGEVEACAAGDLQLNTGATDAGMMKQATAFTFTNDAEAPCSLDGYPTVILLDGDGNPLKDIAQSNATSSYFFSETAVSSVVLDNGEQAGFGIQLTGQTTDTPCKSFSQLRALPPGSEIGTEGTDALTVDFEGQVCDGVTVVPIRKGVIAADDF